jgi:hypothetical protein
MPVHIDKHLNFVIPVQGDGVTTYVHSMPIGEDVFDRYFLVISKTFAAIYNEGLGVTAGPRVAAKLLKRVATEMGVWDGADGVQTGLMTEIRRLTNVVAPGPNGWTTFPFQDALGENYLSKGDVSEVENALVFFTVASAMHRRAELESILNGAGSLWGARVEPLNCTEFAASLTTSTATGSSGATAQPSSIPV